MGIITLKCSNCNGDIKLDNDKKFGFCMYCGTKIVLQQDVNNINIKTDLSKQVRNFTIALRTAMIQGDYRTAVEYANRVISLDESVTDAWLLRADAINHMLLNESGNFVERMSKVFSNTDEMLHKYNLYSTSKMDLNVYFDRYAHEYRFDITEYCCDHLMSVAENHIGEDDVQTKSAFVSDLKAVSVRLPGIVPSMVDRITNDIQRRDYSEKVILCDLLSGIGDDVCTIRAQQLLDGIRDDYAIQNRSKVERIIDTLCSIERQPLTQSKIEAIEKIGRDCTADGGFYYGFYTIPMMAHLRNSIAAGDVAHARDVLFFIDQRIFYKMKQSADWHEVCIPTFQYSFDNAERLVRRWKWYEASSEIQFAKKMYPELDSVKKLDEKINVHIKR